MTDDVVCVWGGGRRTETGEGKTLGSEGTFQVLARRWLPWICKARTAAISQDKAPERVGKM